MSNEAIFSQVESKILEQNDLTRNQLEKSLSLLHGNDMDFAEVYLSHNVSEGLYISENLIKNGSFSISSGLGVRIVAGEKTSFAYSDSITPSSLFDTVDVTRQIGKVQGSSTVHLAPKLNYAQVFSNVNPFMQCQKDRKVQILQEMNAFIRDLDSRVSQVSISISSSSTHRLIASTDDIYAADIKPYSKLYCSVDVRENDKIEKGYCSIGIAGDFSELDDLVPVLDNDYIDDVTDITLITQFEKKYLSVARTALRNALRNLEAKVFKACKMPIVLASGWPAVIIHEAVGHGLEIDAIRKGTSIFKDSLGKKVASDLCTVIDDGTIVNRLGSGGFDGEGTPTSSNVLIKDGILSGFMYDKLNAKLLGKKSTGNGRRMSYSCLPIPRMTNTYLEPRNDDPLDILKSLKQGIYAINFKGGQVDTATGNFTFSTNSAFYVENGEIKYPVKDVTLIGNGQETLKNITRVGNNLKFDKGDGFCGKQGQAVHVGVGQPTIRVEDVTIGGGK